MLGSSCASLQSAEEPSSYTESTALLTDASTEKILEEAISLLMARNLPLAVVNERLGIIQTEYVPASMIDTSLGAAGHAVQLTFSLNVDSLLGRRRVQLRAFSRAPDRTSVQPLTRYLLDTLAAELGHRLGVPYHPRIQRKDLDPILKQLALKHQRPRFQQGFIAIGVIAGTLFLVSLLSGAFAASSGG